MRNKSTLTLNVLLVVADFAALVAAFVLAYILRVKIDTRPLVEPLAAASFLKIHLLILPVWLMIFGRLGLYNSESTYNRLSEFMKIVKGCLGGTIFIIVLDFLSRQPIFPARLVPLYGLILAILIVSMERQLVYWARRWWFYRIGIGLKKIVIVGSGPVVKQLVEGLINTQDSGYKIVCIIGRSVAGSKNIPVYQNLEAAKKRIVASGVDEIVQAEFFDKPKLTNELTRFARAHHIKYLFYPSPSEIYSAQHNLNLLAGLPMIEVGATPLDGWGRVVKRLFDIVGASLGLIIFSPLMWAVAIAIKLSGGGPIIYKHRRLTRFGEAIVIYKFRTMAAKYGKQDPLKVFSKMKRLDLVREFKAHFKVKDDPRVTPLGRWLRLTSLDELPQLWNVLSGQLSLVGPRPITKLELARFGKDQADFLTIKPGVTGLWQVSGRSQLSYQERIELELFYVQNWSVLLDLKILLKTVWAVLTRRGAA